MPDPKYIPPRDGQCLIEKLIPDDILSYIFRLGAEAQVHDDEWFIEEDDGDEAFEDVDTEEEPEAVEDEDEAQGNLFQEYDATDPNENNSIWTLPFQVRVARVCRRWRQTSLNLPLLWTCITFYEQPPFEDSRLWIERSKDCPLDLTINIPAYPKTEDDSDAVDEYSPDPRKEGLQRLRQILDVASPHVGRWKTFDLSVTTWEQMNCALTRLESIGKAPMLQQLSLYCDEDTGYERFFPQGFKAPKVIFDGNLPKLEHLGLWSVHFDWNILIPRPVPSPSNETLMGQEITTTNLTEIELAFHALDVRPTFQQFSDIVQRSPRLQALKLTCSGPWFPPEHTSRDKIVLPALDTLVLGNQDEPYAIKLIKAFYMPKLTSLSLDLADSSFSNFARCLVAPIEAPSSITPVVEAVENLSLNAAEPEAGNAKPPSLLTNLTFLKLSGFMCEDACARLIYENATRVSRLCLNMKFLPDPFLLLLISNRANSWQDMTPEMLLNISNDARASPLLLPDLQFLTIGGVDGDALVALVAARKAARIPLKELNVGHLSNVKPEDREYIRQNVDDTQYVFLSDDEILADEEDEDDEDDEEDGEEAVDGGDEPNEAAT